MLCYKVNIAVFIVYFRGFVNIWTNSSMINNELSLSVPFSEYINSKDTLFINIF